MKLCVTLKDYDCTPEEINRLEALFTKIDHKPRPSEDELCQIAQEYDAVLIGIREKLTPSVYKHATKLRYIGTVSIGLDHIDPIFRNDPQKHVLSAPTANVHSVAEFILGHILYITRGFTPAHISFLSGEGRTGLEILPSDLCAKKIGIVGAGKIARRLITLLEPYSPEVAFWTFNPQNHKDLKSPNVYYKEFQQLMNDSDFVVNTIPSSEISSKLIGKEAIDAISPKAKIINISRLETFDIEYLIKKLQEGSFQGSLIDCFPQEVNLEAIKSIKGVTFTPHIAGVTPESLARMNDEVFCGFERVIKPASL